MEYSPSGLPLVLEVVGLLQQEFAASATLVPSPASMLATVATCALVGLDGRLVEVQVDIARQGLPNFLIVGQYPRRPLDWIAFARERSLVGEQLKDHA